MLLQTLNLRVWVRLPGGSYQNIFRARGYGVEPQYSFMTDQSSHQDHVLITKRGQGFHPTVTDRGVVHGHVRRHRSLLWLLGNT